MPTYDDFKVKCLELDEVLPPLFMTRALVALVLEWLFEIGDKTRLESVIERNRSLISFLTRSENSKLSDSERVEMIERIKKHVAKLPKQTQDYYALYVDFCEKVVSRLLEENILDSLSNFNTT